MNELRRHAYSFGNAKNQFKSTYRDNLCKIKNEDSRKNSEYMHEVTRGQAKDLRKTHLIMGFQNNFENKAVAVQPETQF